MKREHTGFRGPAEVKAEGPYPASPSGRGEEGAVADEHGRGVHEELHNDAYLCVKLLPCESGLRRKELSLVLREQGVAAKGIGASLASRGCEKCFDMHAGGA